MHHAHILETMAPNHRHQKKAEEDAIREANFTAAIQAIREKKTKNLHIKMR
jgi:hypothetical protein